MTILYRILLSDRLTHSNISAFLFYSCTEIDIYKVVQESVRLFRITPRSATYRQYAPVEKDTAPKIAPGYMDTGNGFAHLVSNVCLLLWHSIERIASLRRPCLFPLCSNCKPRAISCLRSVPSVHYNEHRSAIMVCDVLCIFIISFFLIFPVYYVVYGWHIA